MVGLGSVAVLGLGVRRATGVQRCCVARTVRTCLIVVEPLGLEDDSSLQEAAEELAINALITELVVDASNMPAPPRTARGDLDRPKPSPSNSGWRER